MQFACYPVLEVKVLMHFCIKNKREDVVCFFFCGWTGEIKMLSVVHGPSHKAEHESLPRGYCSNYQELMTAFLPPL